MNDYILICFDRPKRWFNRLWCIAFNQKYCHVRILEPTLDDSGDMNDFELTWDGFIPGYTVDPKQFDNTYLTIYYPISLYNAQRMAKRIDELNQYKLRWSIWYAIPALIHGHFGTFTCASTIYYILTGCIDHDVLPDALANSLLDGEIKDEGLQQRD